VWHEFNWLSTGPCGGSCEHGNRPSASIQGGEFFDHLSDFQHLKKEPVPWS
jgi:hypothetical protein